MSDRRDGTTGTGRVRRTQRWDLSAVPEAAPHARHRLTALLRGTTLEPRADDAALALSELVTNAVLHGREPLYVVADLDGDRLRVEVHDASPVSPSFSMLDPTAVTGRGLLLVSTAADSWGVEPTPHGKTVWFALAGPVGAEVDVDVDALLAAWADDLADPAEEVVRVVLTDLDTALMARSEAQVEALLRELALVLAGTGRSAESRRTAERVLSAATELDPLRSEVKRQLAAALAEGRARLDVSLQVARLDAECVRDFASALDEADRLSRLGRLLTEPTPRELSDVRQGYLHRVIAQLSS